MSSKQTAAIIYKSIDAVCHAAMFYNVRHFRVPYSPYLTVETQIKADDEIHIRDFNPLNTELNPICQ